MEPLDRKSQKSPQYYYNYTIQAMLHMQGMSEVIRRKTRKTIGYGTSKRVNTEKVQLSLSIARLVNAVDYQLFKHQTILTDGKYANLKTATKEIAILAEDNYTKVHYFFTQAKHRTYVIPSTYSSVYQHMLKYYVHNHVPTTQQLSLPFL